MRSGLRRPWHEDVSGEEPADGQFAVGPWWERRFQHTEPIFDNLCLAVVVLVASLIVSCDARVGTGWGSRPVKIWEDDARTGKRNHQTATAGATFLSPAFLSLGFLSPDSLVLVGLSISSRWGVSYWAVSYHWAISHRNSLTGICLTGLCF